MRDPERPASCHWGPLTRRSERPLPQNRACWKQTPSTSAALRQACVSEATFLEAATVEHTARQIEVTGTRSLQGKPLKPASSGFDGLPQILDALGRTLLKASRQRIELVPA